MFWVRIGAHRLIIYPYARWFKGRLEGFFLSWSWPCFCDRQRAKKRATRPDRERDRKPKVFTLVGTYVQHQHITSNHEQLNH